MHDERPLHEMAPTQRFSDRVADYVRYRPGYPDAAIDALTEGIMPAPDALLADVGAGTGICTRLLAERGFRVVAIEPNLDMREAAASPIASHDSRVAWRDGIAEQTGLNSESVDAVICAQAFHWFRPADALREFARILKPRGRLGLIWNQRDSRDPLTAAYRQAILNASGEHPAERHEYDPESLAQSGLFSPAEYREFPNSQKLDQVGFIGRATSASYVPKSGDAHHALVQRLQQIHAQHCDNEGFVTLRYVTQVYLATSKMEAPAHR